MSLALAARSLPAAGRAALLLPHDARAEGLGGLSAVLDGGGLASGANPAFLAGREGSELALSHQSWIAGLHQEDLGYAQAWGPGRGLALQLSSFGVPSFDSTGGGEAPIESGLDKFGLGVGQRFGSGAGLGLSLAYSRQTLGPATLQDLMLGLGAQSATPWKPLTLGLNLRQIGLWRSASAELPSDAALGAALDLGSFWLGLEAQVPWHGGDVGWRGGTQWRLHKALVLRLGLSTLASAEQAVAPDFGLGLSVGSMSLDLASTGRGSLGNTLAATLRIAWATPAPAAPSAGPAAAGAVAAATPEPVSPVVAPAAAEHPHRTTRSVRPSPRRETTAVPETPSVEAPSSGDFELDARAMGAEVALEWPDLLAGESDPNGYEVLIGLVPGASMRRLGEKLQASNKWQGDMGMRGMTYYFRVKAYGKAGRFVGQSKVRAVTMP